MKETQQPAGNRCCATCGHPQTPDAEFCEKCGAHFNGDQQEANLGGAPQLEANLRKFRARLTASCPHCRYRGLMGWNDYHFPIAKAVWMPVAILLCLLGILPGLIVFLFVQRAKRYEAECPNCGQALLLKMNEAEQVKSTWGGAQFYDPQGEKIADTTMLARAGKWVLIGLAGLIGLFVLVGIAGVLIEKAGIKGSGKEVSSLVGRYTDTDQEWDGRTFREFHVLDVTAETLKFRLRLVGTDSANKDVPVDVELHSLTGEAKLQGNIAEYRSGSGDCVINMRFDGAKASVEQHGRCGFESDGLTTSVYQKAEKASSPSNAVSQNPGDVSPRAVAWVATSHTASAITGDIQLASDKIVMANAEHPLTLSRILAPSELADAGRITSATQVSSARLYKTSIPPTSTLVNGNTICGTDSAQWMLAVNSGESELSLAFFSGNTEPNLAYNVVSTSRELCGTYGYNQ